MEIHIVYCTDDNFACVCATSMFSVMENKAHEEIFFHIIDNCISAVNKSKMCSLVAQYRDCRIEFCKFPNLEEIFSSALRFDSDHISVSSFGRLFLEKVVSEDVPRILYLDCDTIVLKSLSYLYSTDLNGKCIGGVDDCKSVRYRRVLGIPDKANYINAGVLLINYPMWKKEKCEERIVQYLEKHHGRVHFEDQGAINAVLYDQIQLLPLQNNVMTHLFDLSYEELMAFRKPVIAYRELEIESAKTDPTILHFTSSFLTRGRAWDVKTDHSQRTLYQSYMYKVGCAENKKEREYSFKAKVRIWMVEHLPRKCLLRLATIVHEYADPLKYWLIMRRKW